MTRPHVLAVPRAALDGLPDPALFEPDPEPWLAAAIGIGAAFVERDPAEQDPSLLQLIPVVVFRDRVGCVLAYRRAVSDGDERLRDRWSLSMGGHIEPHDWPGDVDPARLAGRSLVGPVVRSAIWRCLAREVREEAGLDLESLGVECLGMIRDDRPDGNPVPIGSVHWGLVYRAEVDRKRIAEAIAPALEHGRAVE